MLQQLADMTGWHTRFKFSLYVWLAKQLMSRPAVSMLPSLGDKLHRPSGGSWRMQLNLQLCMEGKQIMEQVLYLTLSG